MYYYCTRRRLTSTDDRTGRNRESRHSLQERRLSCRRHLGSSRLEHGGSLAENEKFDSVDMLSLLCQGPVLRDFVTNTDDNVTSRR